jgi:gluconokinase
MGSLDARARAVTVVLMGPAGAGKTTVGQRLAQDLRWPFLDADSLHSSENVARMHRGESLTDADREPWLQRVHDTILQMLATSPHVAVACSALKQHYRDVLASGVPDVRWIYLQASPALLEHRLSTRTGHFAGSAILAGQLADLETPVDALVVPASLPPTEAVALIRSAIGS